MLFNLIGTRARTPGLLVLGPIWAAIYYGVFPLRDPRFNLMTPGREVDTVESAPRRAGGTGGQFARTRARLRRTREYPQSRRLHHAPARIS